MSKYPDWLIQEVAEAAASEEEYEKVAEAVLDALEFREDQSFGVLSEGFLMTGFMVKDSPNYGRVTRWRSILPWRKDDQGDD